MQRIIADYDIPWTDLSEEHKNMRERVCKLLDRFYNNEKVDPSYLVSGIYGSGKTMFLLLVVKESVKRGIVPIYILADDIIENCSGKTYQELKSSIDEYISAIYSATIAGSDKELQKLIKINGSGFKETIYNKVKDALKKDNSKQKYVVLVDEMEDSYNTLKGWAGVDPLREWLSDPNYMKFIAMTPSGIHDLGGADEGRLSKEFRMPHVSLSFLRKELNLQPGPSNLLWWLSRGIPRQIIKNIETVRSIYQEISESELIEKLKSLDRIGKNPGVVDAIYPPKEHKKLKWILTLQPNSCEDYDGLKISQNISEGELSDALQRTFNLTSDSEKIVALLLSKHMKSTAGSLSDSNLECFLPIEEIADFLRLCIDSMIDSENRKDEVRTNLLKIWEMDRLQGGKGSVLIAELTSSKIPGFEYNKLKFRLPFKISEVREMFPFIISDPVIKSQPNDVFKILEGHGMPVISGDNFYFFASSRDLISFSKSEAFRSKVLKDGMSGVVLVMEPSNSSSINNNEFKDIYDNTFIKWLIDGRKLRIVNIQNQLSRFLLSVYGISEDQNIASIEKKVMEGDDTMLKRRFSFYYSGFQQLINENILHSEVYFIGKGDLKGAQDTWGEGQLKEETVAVAGLTLVFLSSLLLISNVFCP